MNLNELVKTHQLRLKEIKNISCKHATSEPCLHIIEFFQVKRVLLVFMNGLKDIDNYEFFDSANELRDFLKRQSYLTTVRFLKRGGL